MQIVSARSWRGVRARERTFCAEPAHQDTGKDQAGKLAIRSVDNRGGRGSQWQFPYPDVIACHYIARCDIVSLLATCLSSTRLHVIEGDLGRGVRGAGGGGGAGGVMQHCLRALLARSAGPRGDVLY